MVHREPCHVLLAGILLPILPVYLDCLDFCEGIFIKDFVIPSQGGTQGHLPCFIRGDIVFFLGLWFIQYVTLTLGTYFFSVLCREELAPFSPCGAVPGPAPSVR